MNTDSELASRWRPLIDRGSLWDPPPVPTIVVSPHPDDESLSSGGLIARQRSRGYAVTVIAVTDGERAYPDDPPTELAATRRDEQRRALGRLGVGPDDLHRLGLPDGSVADHADDVRDAVLEHLVDGALLIAPWTHDVHPDHEAVGRAAAAAADARQCTLRSSLFWTWHKREPAELDDFDVCLMRLTDDESAARSEALDHHRSQLHRAVGEPILPKRFLEPFRWGFEVFVSRK